MTLSIASGCRCGLPKIGERPKLHPMKAGILAVGTELLGTDRVDTNSLLLTSVLQRYGIEVYRKEVVRDLEDEIAQEVRRWVSELDLVLITGGLGPTTDDRTRQGVARALGRDLRRDPGLLDTLRTRFEKWGMVMPVSNEGQADIIDGAQVVENPRGTAPGLKIEHGNSTIFLFPGVPSELEEMVASTLEPWIASHTDGSRTETRILRIACMSESALEDRLAPLYEDFDAHMISVLASPGDIQVHLTSTGPAEGRQKALDAMTERLRSLVGHAFYGIGARTSLEERVAQLLIRAAKTVSTAESCTAGLLAERLTRVSGSSDYFLGGVVTYSDELKQRLLGVSAATLEAHGAVSREVVMEMAEGAVRELGSDFGIGISGIAGPGGGTEEKPVGTVHVAVALREAETDHRELHLPGGRQRVRWLASQWSLDMLRRRLQ